MPVNKKQIILILIILILIFFSLNHMYLENKKKQNKVVVFILDTRVNQNFVEKKPVLTGSEITHGSLVARIIKDEATDAGIISYSVAGKDNTLKEWKYYNGLRKVLAYKINHPEKRVLVNFSISLSNIDPEHHELIKSLKGKDIVMIAAAGNNNSDRPVYPAGFKEVVAVANADLDGKAPSSNYGEYIDISAPGTAKYLTRIFQPRQINYNKIIISGTSFSAPRVTGLLARLLNLNPTLNPEEGITLLKETADQIKTQEYTNLLGAGVINKNRLLSKYDSFYWLKGQLATILLLIYICGLFLYFFFKEGIIGILLAILFIIFSLPLFYIGKELFNLIDPVILGVAIITTMIFTHYHHKFKKQALERLLKEGFELNVLLGRAVHNKGERDQIVTFLSGQINLYYKELISILKNDRLKEKELVVKILSRSFSEQVLEKFILTLTNPEYDRIKILEIIAEYQQEAEKAVPVIKDLIFYEDEMWLRYQALSTLASIHPQPAKLRPLLQALISDHQELVRIEAIGIIKDLDLKVKKTE